MYSLSPRVGETLEALPDEAAKAAGCLRNLADLRSLSSRRRSWCSTHGRGYARQLRKDFARVMPDGYPTGWSIAVESTNPWDSMTGFHPDDSRPLRVRKPMWHHPD
eukprot:IDg5503t1